MSEQQSGAISRFAHGVKYMYGQILIYVVGLAVLLLAVAFIVAVPNEILEHTVGAGTEPTQQIFRRAVAVMVWNIFVTIPLAKGIKEVVKGA